MEREVENKASVQNSTGTEAPFSSRQQGSELKVVDANNDQFASKRDDMVMMITHDSPDVILVRQLRERHKRCHSQR